MLQQQRRCNPKRGVPDYFQTAYNDIFPRPEEMEIGAIVQNVIQQIPVHPFVILGLGLERGLSQVQQ